MQYQLNLSEVADENNKIQGWAHTDHQHEHQCNLFKLLQKQINCVPTKSTPLTHQNSHKKQGTRPQTGRQIYSSIGTYGNKQSTPTQKTIQTKNIKYFIAERQQQKKQNKKQTSQYIMELQKKYNSVQGKKKEDQRNLLDMKKQSLIFNSNQQLRPKNYAENMKNFHDLQKKVKFKSNNFKKSEDKLKLLIVVKKNKQNEVALKIKNSQKNLTGNQKSYGPLSFKNRKRIIVENDLFSDFHLSKKEKMLKTFQRLT